MKRLRPFALFPALLCLAVEGCGVAAPTFQTIAPRLHMSDARFLPRREQLYQRAPCLAFGDGLFLIVWQEGYNGLGGASDILGLRIGTDGIPLDKAPIPICTAESVQDSPAVAFCNGRFLVVWADFRNGDDYDLYATRVDPKGKVASADGFLLAGGKGGQAAPAATSNGKDTFFVVWQDHRGGKEFDTYGVRVAAASGSVLDKGGKLLLPGGETPAVAWNGTNYFVSVGRRGCLVGPGGVLARDLPKLWSGKKTLPATAVTAWGKALGIFNTSSRPDPWGWGGNGSIIGVSVTPDGQSPEYGATKHDWYHSARFRADRVTKNAIDAARWRNQNEWPMGMPGGFKGSHEDTWPSGRVAAAWNGRSLLVVWNRAHFVERYRIGQRDVYLKRVMDDWVYIDEPKLLIAAAKTDEIFPALAADTRGNALLAYEKQQAEGGIGIEVRVLREDKDKDPPRVAYVARMSPEQMILGFDEPVDPEGASNVENYTIDGVKIRSAEFYKPNPGLMRQVVLNTDAQEPGKTYVLRVKGVRDLSAAKNAAAGEPFQYVCKPGVSQRSDFIERWNVVGIWPNNPDVEFVAPETVHPSPGDKVAGKTDEELQARLKPVVAASGLDWEKGNWEENCGKQFGGDKQWRALGTQAASLLRLSGAYGSKWLSAAYANTYVYSDRERDVIVRVDSNDGNRTWLNGKLVHDELHVGKGRGIHEYTNETPAKLRNGWNQLLIRIGNDKGHWLMVAQIVDTRKQPIRDLTYQLESPFK